ncbi:MAG: hypothetical protein KAI24_17925 [Planctomycetes bacterium]|nr:hypothetical protein [Planctomycetota bacterium]
MKTDRNQVLDPETGSYVLPAPPRGHRDQLVTDTPQQPGAAMLATAEAARGIGARLQLQADSLDGFLGELRERLEQLDLAIAEDSRAQLKGAVREIGSVVDWCEAVQHELAAESARAQAGQEPIDLVALCEQVANARQEMTEPISVVGHAAATCWGERGRLAHMISLALQVVWARTGQRGLRCLEVQWQDSVPCVRVRSRGEPTGEIDAELVDRFREAARAAGAAVVPDEHGPGGAGLVLRLPT